MSGNDEMISGSKIEPLASPTKYHEPTLHVGGVIGDDHIVDSSRIGPMRTFKKFQHPLAHVHAGGSVGTDEMIGSSNLEPLMAVGKDTSRKDSLDDEKIDGARIAPLGSVRDEVS